MRLAYQPRSVPILTLNLHVATAQHSSHLQVGLFALVHFKVKMIGFSQRSLWTVHRGGRKAWFSSSRVSPPDNRVFPLLSKTRVSVSDALSKETDFLTPCPTSILPVTIMPLRVTSSETGQRESAFPITSTSAIAILRAREAREKKGMLSILAMQQQSLCIRSAADAVTAGAKTVEKVQVRSH